MIDLHTHSRASDGTDAPGQVMADAAAAGLSVIALTDHDTTAGWAEAADAVAATGVALIRGAEVSASWEGVSVHLLSYLHDPTHPDLRRLFAATRADRETRLEKMAARLAADFPITWETVQAQVTPGATLGRPHLADALVAAGVVEHRDDAFATILAPGTPYYVPHYAPDAALAVRAIVAAGGVPVFAHPGATMRGRTVPDHAFDELVEAGLAGIEVDHRDHDDATRERLRATAARLGVFTTGSSDYHGTGKHNRLGENTTSPEVLEQIESQGALKVLRP